MELNIPLIKNEEHWSGFQKRGCGFKKRCSSLIALAIAITTVLCMAILAWINDDPGIRCRNEHKFYVICSATLTVHGIIIIAKEAS